MTPTKASLRATLLARRLAIPATERLAAAAAMAHHFADHPFLTYAASFAAYVAMRAEAEPLPIFTRMAKFAKRTALPRINAADSPLTFHEWQPGAPLTDGPHGTRQPTADSPAFIPEVVLVPLLGFDLQGHRLGYGGGFYDRTIAHLRASMATPPLFVGLAFAAQEIPEVPTEHHDETLDGVLTEEGASFFNRK